MSAINKEIGTIAKHVEDLVAKAAKAEKSEDAMRYSQAALNAAHAGEVLLITGKDK